MARDPYASIRKAALRQIKAKGTVAKFSRAPGATVKDPITQQQVSTGAGGAWNRHAVGLPPGKTWTLRGQTQISAEMEELHVAPEGYSPLNGDTVYWKGRVWKVLDAVIYDPNGSGQPLYFRVLIE